MLYWSFIMGSSPIFHYVTMLSIYVIITYTHLQLTVSLFTKSVTPSMFWRKNPFLTTRWYFLRKPLLRSANGLLGDLHPSSNSSCSSSTSMSQTVFQIWLDSIESTEVSLLSALSVVWWWMASSNKSWIPFLSFIWLHAWFKDVVKNFLYSRLR